MGAKDVTSDLQGDDKGDRDQVVVKDDKGDHVFKELSCLRTCARHVSWRE